MTVPIADYGLLSDCQGAALVSRDGSVDWWCAPRFDSRATFARMLDPAGGRFLLRLAGATAERRYLDDTLVLETTWTAGDGAVVRVLDALALEADEDDAHGHDLGRRVPHALLRTVECLAGTARIEVEWSPRLEFGLVAPHLERTEDGVRTAGGPDSAFLQVDGPVSLELDGSDARAAVELREGDRLGFASVVREGYGAEAPAPLDPAAQMAATAGRWRAWSEHHLPPAGGFASALVRRSTLVLQALSYAPTGAMVAAPTTSLPEVPGGEANWDYRFCWLRDASLVVKAFLGTGCRLEAQRFFAFIAGAAGPVEAESRMQIVYGIGGEHDLGERELGFLAGYGGAAPVRLGNGAWDQQQLDVPGFVLDAAWTLAGQDGEDPFPETVQAFLRALADHAADHWSEPDSGIWEGREGEREYLPSRVLAWVALDRAVRLAEAGRLGAGEARAADAEHWAHARDEVHAAVLERGFAPGVGAFTGAFGSDHHDAAVLLMPLLGFLPAEDERMAATLDAVERDLTRDGLLMRWTGAEDEGRFLACTFWLAHALALRGELDRARAAFERAASCASDLGLLSEMAESAGGALLGNHPQALTHVALINAATCIDAMERAAAG